MRQLGRLSLDVLALAGLAAVVRGVYLIYLPAAWIIGGALVFLGALALARTPTGGGLG